MTGNDNKEDDDWRVSLPQDGFIGHRRLFTQQRMNLVCDDDWKFQVKSHTLPLVFELQKPGASTKIDDVGCSQTVGAAAKFPAQSIVRNGVESANSGGKDRAEVCGRLGARQQGALGRLCDDQARACVSMMPSDIRGVESSVWSC